MRNSLVYNAVATVVKRLYNKAARPFYNYSVWNSEDSHGQLFHAWNDVHAYRKGLRIAVAEVKAGNNSFRDPSIVSGDSPWGYMEGERYIDFAPKQLRLSPL